METWRTRVSWIVVLALVVAQVQLPASSAFAQGNPPSREQEWTRFEGLFDALEAAAAEIPRDTFDPQAALMQTDLTPEGVFSWVRDNTSLVPYRGALRGPVGVLMDRVGNSLDRALLLQELLHGLGYDTRLARAQLTEAEARHVLHGRRPLTPGGARPPATSHEARSDIERHAASFGLDAVQLEQALERTLQQHAALQGRLRSRIGAQTSHLGAALNASSGDPSTTTAEQLAALQDHWWVEYLEAGRWTGLDPTLADAAPGQTAAMAAEYLTATIEALPSDLLHTLQIRTVLECGWDSGLQETTLVESPVLVLASLQGQRIAINHVPAKMPQISDPSDVAAVRSQILEQDHWFPMISIGRQQIYTHDFTSSCQIGTAVPPTFGTAAEGAFDAALGVFEEPSPNEPERVTAQWIEYSLHVPGDGEQVVRRQIFDVLGPAARTTFAERPSTDAQAVSWRLALMGETEILPMSSAFSPEYVGWITAQSLVASRDALLEFVHRAPPASQLTEIANRLDRQPSRLHALALTRHASGGAGLFLDQANILSYHRQHTFNGTGEIVVLEGFDIVVNSVAVDASTVDPARSRLAQGVADTNAEAALMALACESTDDAGCSATTNPSALYEAMADQKISWVTVRDETDLADLRASPDVRARVLADVRGGYVVVIPESSVRVAGEDVIGWWRIDPDNGATLGIGELGWGAEIAEYVLASVTLGIGTASCLAGSSATSGSWAACVMGALVGGFAIMALSVPVVAAYIGVMSAFFLAMPSFTN